MANDDEKPNADDDPWASLEADGLPDLTGDFSFSFDEPAAAEPTGDEPASEEAAVDEPAAEDLTAETPAFDEAFNEQVFEERAAAEPAFETSEPAFETAEPAFETAEPAFEELAAAGPAVVEPAAEEPAAEEPVAEEPAFDVPAFDEPAFDVPSFDTAADEPGFDEFAFADAAAEEPEAAAPPEELPAGSSAEAFSPPSDESDAAEEEGSGPLAAADEAIEDWLSDPADAMTEATSSVLADGAVAEMFSPDGESLDVASGQSSIEIGTGTSGIVSPSGVDPLAEAGEDAESEPDPFAAFAVEDTAEGGGETFDFAAAEADPDAGEIAVAGGLAATAVSAGSSAEPARRPAKGKRTPPGRRKQPSAVGQLVGVVLGGTLAIPITLGILIWGFGKDPFGLTPMVPDSLGFLLPAKFRADGGRGPAATGLAAARGLDAVLGDAGSGGDEEPPLGDDGGLGDAADPSTSLTELEPEPVEPGLTDLAVVDPVVEPVTDDGVEGGDPLLDLLNEDGEESPPAMEPEPQPEPEPEPEPLDLRDLDAAVAAATASLEAVVAVDDPDDPVRRRLLAKWYRSLAGFAEELVNLDALAAETGRPFGPAGERAEAVRGSLMDHPQLVAELAALTRDWVAYGRRPSDGLMMPGTFVASRRMGPYWRSQVTLPAAGTRPATEMVVLTRTEPAVAPGDAVVVTGLALDDDVVWAVELRPAEAVPGGLPGL